MPGSRAEKPRVGQRFLVHLHAQLAAAYMTRMEVKGVTVWYDGGCPLCLREIALMRRLDRAGRIQFDDVSADGAACPIDRTLLLARFHAREDGGPILSGAAAFAAMWRAIPLLRPLGLAARVPVVLWALERAYGGFLKIRPWLQRRFA